MIDRNLLELFNQLPGLGSYLFAAASTGNTGAIL
jgi:hypothetical protein